jgi:DNA-binding LytR/AlgR family response regulator
LHLSVSYPIFALKYEKLMKALRKTQSPARKKVRHIPLWPDIHLSQSNTMAEIPLVSKIAFQVQNGVEFIDPLKVTHLEAQSNYTAIYCTHGRRILISRTLKSCTGVFPGSFLRIHQSYLVNPQHIQTYLRHENLLRLDNGLELSVSRSGKLVMQEFVKNGC